MTPGQAGTFAGTIINEARPTQEEMMAQVAALQATLMSMSVRMEDQSRQLAALKQKMTTGAIEGNSSHLADVDEVASPGSQQGCIASYDG